MARKRKDPRRGTLAYAWALFGVVFVGGLTWMTVHPAIGFHPVAVADASDPAPQLRLMAGEFGVATDEAINLGAVGGYAQASAGDRVVVNGKEYQLAGIRAARGVGHCHDNAYGWECGVSARDALAGLLSGRAIACRPRGVFRNGVEVADCVIGSQPPAHVLVREGLAVTVEGEGPSYTMAQVSAQKDRRGVWANH